MSTTDITFLFIFLPISLVTYLMKTQWQKYILLLLSLFFIPVVRHSNFDAI